MLCSLHPVSGRWQTGSHANAGRSGHRQWTHAFRKEARMTGGIRNDDGASLPRPTRRMPPVSSRSHVPRSPPTREPASRPIGQSRNDGGPRGVAHQPESRMECRSEHQNSVRRVSSAFVPPTLPGVRRGPPHLCTVETSLGDTRVRGRNHPVAGRDGRHHPPAKDVRCVVSWGNLTPSTGPCVNRTDRHDGRQRHAVE